MSGRKKISDLAFYTVKEVATKLQLSLSKVYAMIARGDLNCHSFGSCYRISEDDLTDFLSANRVEQKKLPRSKGRHF